MKRSGVLRVFLGFGGLTAAFLLLEAGLRLAGIDFGYPTFRVFDEQRGYAYRPNAQGWLKGEQIEEPVFIQINSQGLRDQEHNLSKAPSALRIAVLGDSYTAALEMPLERTFWWVAKEGLAASPGFQDRPVEIMNFGVSGYGTAQELITLRRRVWAYDPDVVLLAFCTGNDISNNVRELEENQQIPFFVLEGNRLHLDDSFRKNVAWRTRQSRPFQLYYQALEHVRCLQLVSRAKNALQNARGGLAQANLPPTAGEEPGLDSLVYRPPADATWKKAWTVTERLLLEMRDEVHARGARFLLVTLSNGIQVHPDSNLRRQFQEQMGVSDLFYPERRLQEFSDQHDIALLALAPLLHREAQSRGVFLHGFGPRLGEGHWNAQGHRLAGRLIAQKLRTLLAHEEAAL